ncbi:MAG: helix-turn-helix transcriptional regulator [Erysipelotrichaceae bacterium]|nr:helix-turn-helix transcriptional regulator [Erysipelotrichaceae bacterium]
MNPYLLDAKIKQKGLTLDKISSILGIDPATFYRKKKGESDFSRKEIQILRKTLDLTNQEVDSIFFTDSLT